MANETTNEQTATDLVQVNERIARAMGWRVVYHPEASYYHDPYRLYAPGASDFLRSYKNESSAWQYFSEFSTTWEGAREVTLWLRSSQKLMSMDTVHGNWFTGDHWHYVCVILRPDSDTSFVGQGADLPEALCNAVIALLDARPELEAQEVKTDVD